MRIMNRVVLGAAVAVATASPSSAVIDKCQKSISKEVLKLESKIVKSIVKGADTYQKAAAKGDPISGITGKVNDTLAKAIDVANPKSAVSKTMAKLSAIGPSDKATCTDADLFSLGFIPEGIGGDRWTRLAVIASLQTAYENAVLGNATFGADYQAMVDAGGCSLCSILANPSCVDRTCTLDPASGGQTNSATGVVLTSTTGSVPVGSCNVPSIMPPGEFATIGGAQRGLDPIVVGGAPGSLVVACVTTLRTMGVQNCTGTMPSVDYDVCVDHTVEDIGGILVDECETGGGSVQVALPDVDDPNHPGVVNGGAVVTFTTGAPSSGESFVVTANKIQVLLESLGEFGVDGVPCTPDDSPAISTPATVQMQTTGTATTEVIDSNNTEGNGLTTTTTVSGSPFDCSATQTGGTTGETVSAFSALHAIFTFDQSVNNTLICD